MSAPEITTPADTAASPSMWMKAPRLFTWVAKGPSLEGTNAADGGARFVVALPETAA